MQSIIDIILQAGKGAMDVALYTLLPIMVVMLILLRLLEAWGVIDRFVAIAAPIVRPFGMTGLGVLSIVQINLVSFVAPLPTLALMEDRGTSDRHLAAAFAAVLAAAPANAAFPLSVYGLHVGPVAAFSVIGSILAATLTYHGFGRRLSNAPRPITKTEQKARENPGLMNIINVAGGEAVKIVIGIIPMLLVSLVVVVSLRQVGAIDGLSSLLAPVLQPLGLGEGFVLPAITKYLAGSTALVAVVHDLSVRGGLDAATVSTGGGGFLLHPLDLPGVAILLSAGPRLAATLFPALLGGICGIALRTILGAFMG